MSKRCHVGVLAPKNLSLWITLAGCPTYAQVFEKPLGGSCRASRITAYKICYVETTTYVTPPQAICFHIHSRKTSLLRSCCVIVAENDGGGVDGFGESRHSPLDCIQALTQTQPTPIIHSLPSPSHVELHGWAGLEIPTANAAQGPPKHLWPIS